MREGLRQWLDVREWRRPRDKFDEEVAQKEMEIETKEEMNFFERVVEEIQRCFPDANDKKDGHTTSTQHWQKRTSTKHTSVCKRKDLSHQPPSAQKRQEEAEKKTLQKCTRGRRTTCRAKLFELETW